MKKKDFQTGKRGGKRQRDSEEGGRGNQNRKSPGEIKAKLSGGKSTNLQRHYVGTDRVSIWKRKS